MAIKKFKVMASNAKKKAKSDGSCIPKSMRKDVKSGCTKKSVKASDTAKKFRVDIYKKDNPDALVKSEVKTFNSEDEAKKYGESIANGDIVNVIEVKAGCTKKPVKSSKSLTVPKSKRKSVKASTDGWKETDYSVFMDGGRQVMSKYTKDFDGYRIMILPEYNHKTEILSWVVFLFDVDEEPRRLESFETAYDAKDFADYEVYEGYVKPINSSKSVKKFGVKASATAKRIAKSRITAAESDGLERAKQYIVDGYNAENPDSNDMTVDEYFKNEDLHKVGLVYTTLGDNDEYDYQISVDLIDPKVIVEIDGDVVYEDKYSNIDALADDLADFDWDNWYSYYIHKLPAEYDVIFSSCNSAKSINCYYDSSPNYDPWEYQESYDTYYDEEPPEHIAKELERLAKLSDKYKDIWFAKFVELHPNERFSTVYDFSDVDDAVGFTLDMAEYHPDEIKLSTDVNAGITVGQDDRYDFSNPIYELDDYVKALADGVVNQIQGITYDISKETIAFFDDDNNVVFVQPIGGIIPEPDDLETDIDELSAAIKSEMDNAYARVNWESEEDDSDYASRAVELSEDIGEVDIDDLEPITGDGDDEDIDYGFGFDSNGEALDESTIEELYRIAEYEILPKSELAKIDEYVSIDEDSWDFYMSSPHVTEKFYIHFKLTEKDINFNDYALPDGKMFPDFNYYTAVLDFDIYAENGEITSVILEDKKIYRPDGAFDDYDVKRFDDLYNVEALINYVEHLAADTVMDIYNGTTNL